MEYVSPITLNAYLDHPQDYRNSNVDHISMPIVGQSVNNNNSYAPHRGSTSAPEHIAFHSVHQSLPSPADLDFDISPLTSPWLGAPQQSMHNPSSSSSNKRQASTSDDESGMQPSRKKQSPAIRPMNPTQVKKVFRGSRSTNSTPLLRSTRARKGSTAGEVPGDTPSPVDLSMPPPAPPVPSNPAASSSSSGSSSNTSQDPTKDIRPSPNSNQLLMPVTPASIMNLGQLGINSSLSPPTRQTVPSKPDAKCKGAAKQAKTNVEAPTSSRTRTPRKPTNGSLVSPSLKAILPGLSSSPGAFLSPHC